MKKTKTCVVCGKEFAPRHGNQKYCTAECAERGMAESKKRYYRNNKEKWSEYRTEHREERREYDRKYREEHRDRLREYDRRYYLEHREKRRKRSREYYWTHKDERREYAKRYLREHREERREYEREYYREHREELCKHNKDWRERNREKVEAYRFWYRNGGFLEIMARREAEDRAEALSPDEALDLAGIIEATNEKPEGCLFAGSCFECPYSDCVVE